MVLGLLVPAFALAIYFYSSRQEVVSPTDKHSSIQASPTSGRLIIQENNIVVARKGSQLIMLLDLNPNRHELNVAGEGAKELVISTAGYYIKQFFVKPDYQTANSAVVHIVFVESMDEYNRANHSGMKRFGTLTFTKSGDAINLSEDKLSKIP
jgi:hypothetical protein